MPEQFNLVAKSGKGRKKRILEPLTDTKAMAQLRKTDSAFLPSPTKLPSQKLLPLQNPIAVETETEVCGCEQPVVAGESEQGRESQPEMQMTILTRKKSQVKN